MTKMNIPRTKTKTKKQTKKIAIKLKRNNKQKKCFLNKNCISVKYICYKNKFLKARIV
jgi:hypothetical protein